MQATMVKALNLIAGSEGGYSNHKNDPGGPTMKGVTLKNYQRYCRLKKKPLPGIEALKLISNAEVAEIFKLDYWDTIKGDQLSPGVDYIVADFSFNSGALQAAKELQRVVAEFGHNPGKIDGLVGTGTLAAVSDALEHVGEDTLINAYMDRRWAFMQKLKNFPSFKNGWKNRIRDVRANGLIIAHIVAIAPPPPPPVPTSFPPKPGPFAWLRRKH